MHKLHDSEFTYTIPMDGNRAEDGVNLRYRFGYEESYSDRMIASLLDVRSCSVLEMMIALALRCEEDIMENPDIGNRTGCWFWIMIDNLGLSPMDDAHFDERYVDHVIRCLLNHEYEYDGAGGLFMVEDPPGDMRTTEIWYQMCWYLNEIA